LFFIHLILVYINYFKKSSSTHSFRSQGKPIRFAQGKPIRFAQGKPIRFSQGKPIRFALRASPFVSLFRASPFVSLSGQAHSLRSGQAKNRRRKADWR